MALWPVAGALLVLVAGEGGATGPVGAALRWRPLVWLGGLSYGVYLWHWPLLKGLIAVDPGRAAGVGVVEGLAVIAAAIGLSRLSERAIAAARSPRPWPARNALTLAVPGLAAVAAVALVLSPPLQERAIVQQATAQAPPADETELGQWIAESVDVPEPTTEAVVGTPGQPPEWIVDGCVTVDVDEEEDCLYDNDAVDGREVWLVGDSQAVALSLPTRTALEGIASVQLLGRERCPFSASPLVEARPEEHAADCYAQIDRVLELAEERRPELVVIAYGAWWTGKGFEGIGVEMANGTIEIVRQLEALGVDAVWLDSPPPVTGFEACTSPVDPEERAACNAPLDPAHLDRHVAMVDTMRGAGVDVIDTLGWYCDVERMLCPLIVRGVPTWTDPNHLGAAGAMQRSTLLAPALLERVARH